MFSFDFETEYYLNNFLSFKMGKMCPEEDMKQALEEVEDRSVSTRAAAKKYGMTEWTLRK